MGAKSVKDHGVVDWDGKGGRVGLGQGVWSEEELLRLNSVMATSVKKTNNINKNSCKQQIYVIYLFIFTLNSNRKQTQTYFGGIEAMISPQ